MTVNEYRKKHRRCRTCVFSEQNSISWYCKAKGQLNAGYVSETKLRGCLCDLYLPKPTEDKEIPF